MVKLAVFDIDGTLVVKGNRVLYDSTLKALKQLQKQGIKLAIASGRPPFYLEKRLIEQVHFDYYIASNGACILDEDLNCIYRSEISKEEVEIISSLYDETKSSGHFLFPEGCYAYRDANKVLEKMYEFVGRTDHFYDYTQRRDRHLLDLPFANISYIDDAKVHLFEEAVPNIQFERFGKDCYDVHLNAVDKGTGIKEICSLLNIDLKDTISFGDDINDISMLKMTASSVVMGSASEEVKKYATFITKSANEDGVVYALKELNLLEE